MAFILVFFITLVAALVGILGWLGWCSYTWHRDRMAKLRREVSGHNAMLDKFEAEYGAVAVRKVGTRMGRASLRKVRTGVCEWAWQVQYEDCSRGSARW